LENRRAAVRKILATGSLTAGAGASANVWKVPLIESVVLPAHAQTTDRSTASRNAVISGQVGEPEITGLLDLFLSPAYAADGSDLVGGCIEITIEGDTVTVTVTLNTGVSDTKSGTLNDCGFTVEGVNGYTVQGQFDDQDNPTRCDGTVGSEEFIAVINGPCSVISPPTTSTDVPVSSDPP